METITEPELEETNTDSPDKLAHFVDQRIYSLVEAMINGTPVKALCGYVFVPTSDFTKLPKCWECEMIVNYRSRD